MTGCPGQPLGGLGEGDRGATAAQLGLALRRPPLRFAAQLEEAGFAPAGDEQVRPPALAVMRSPGLCRADSLRTFWPGMTFSPDAAGQAISQLLDLSGSDMPTGQSPRIASLKMLPAGVVASPEMLPGA